MDGDGAHTRAAAAVSSSQGEFVLEPLAGVSCACFGRLVPGVRAVGPDPAVEQCLPLDGLVWSGPSAPFAQQQQTTCDQQGQRCRLGNGIMPLVGGVVWVTHPHGVHDPIGI